MPTCTVRACPRPSSSGRLMENFSFPLSSSESAVWPGRKLSGRMPIPSSWLLWSFWKLSAMMARTPCGERRVGREMDEEEEEEENHGGIQLSAHDPDSSTRPRLG